MILNVSGDSLPVIRREVEDMMLEYNLESGSKPRRYLSCRVSSTLDNFLDLDIENNGISH